MKYGDKFGIDHRGEWIPLLNSGGCFLNDRLERRSEMPEGNEPVALAMVLCDGIHIDPGTGKRTLLGLFNSACSPELPARINQLAVYCCITECRDETPFNFRIVDVDEEREVVFETEGILRCNDPLGIVELDLVLGGIEFPAYGEYRL